MAATSNTQSAGTNGVVDEPIDFSTPPPANEANGAAEPKGPAIVFLDHDELFTEDAPNESLVVPALGIGAGPPTGLIGESFVGKTFLAMALGMAVALGRDAWGKFATKSGIWVHFDYEQGRRHTKRRIQRLARAFGVSKEDLRGKLKVTVYPEVNLTTKGAVKHYIEAMKGCAIATVDSLRAITPGADENGSEMRALVRVLTKASEETGCAVLLIHHAGLPQQGRARKNLSRGSTAIRDELQTQLNATGEKGSPILITHDKDRELGYTVDPFRVRIEDVPEPSGDEPNVDLDLKWGIRVVVESDVGDSEDVSMGPSPQQQARAERQAAREREQQRLRDEEDRVIVETLRAAGSSGLKTDELHAALGARLDWGGSGQRGRELTIARRVGKAIAITGKGDVGAPVPWPAHHLAKLYRIVEEHVPEHLRDGGP
jgi:hypothetical protein